MANEIANEIAERGGYLLTSRNNLKIGSKLPDRIRDMMAIIAHKRKDGSEIFELVINNEYERDPDVLQALAFIEEFGVIEKRITATSAEITEIYSSYEKNQTLSMSNIQKIIKEYFTIAASENCSDMHITVKENVGTLIENRRLSDLYIFKNLSFEDGDTMCRTIYQTMCDVADKSFQPKKQQNGRIKHTFLPEELVGVRVATTPTEAGYKMVCRLLYKIDPASLSLEKLGYEEFQIKQFAEIEAKNAGATIISGPTGSGKSTTLLVITANTISKHGGKIHVITVEDPPEYEIYGLVEMDNLIDNENGIQADNINKKIPSYATQIPVTDYKNDEERSDKFNSAIRAAMRLDPDILMIGEIRDTPSAEAMLRASMTGHKVYTTVHANNALTIFSRLFDIGVKKELACDANIITGLIAQLLVRKLCPYCCISLKGNEKLLEEDTLTRLKEALEKLDTNLDKINLRNHKGCDKCYHGIGSRTVIAEIVVCDDYFMELSLQEKRAELKGYWMNELKGVDMLMHAILKIKRGECDPSDIEEQVSLIKLPKEIKLDYFKSLIDKV